VVSVVSLLMRCVAVCVWQSIRRDSQWVEQTRELFPGLPAVANLRNGEWYGKHWDAYSYFKSGDGHNNEW
jgi:tRNA A64-2'-O-ribosylphosphate transferase